MNELYEKNEILENPEFESYWLSHASPDTVFEWIKEQKPDFQEDFGRDREIEKVLVERQEPLIDMGLALYARMTSDTALCLFRNGDTTIKKAILSGPSILAYKLSFFSWPIKGDWLIDKESGILKELLQSFDDNIELLAFLLSNESVPEGLLTSLYERRAPFNELADEQWLEAIRLTALNDAIKQSGDAAWKLFAILPVNKKSAFVLSGLGRTLAPHGEWSFPSAPDDMDVRETIKRWGAENDDEYGYFNNCRAALGRLLENEELKSSDDVALRQAYYACPAWYSRKPEEVRDAFEKDRIKFLDVAVGNVSFYRNQRVRNELEKCFLNFNDDDPTAPFGHRVTARSCWWAARRDRLTQQHPEWFSDYDGEIPFVEIGDLSLRAEERLAFLQKQIKAISRELVGNKSEDDHSSRYDEEKASLIAKMKAELDQSNQLILSKLASVTGWAVFVGIVFAIILIVILIKL